MNFAFQIDAHAAPAKVQRITGAVVGPVAVFLRAEALVELFLAVMAYRSVGGTWTHFAALFLAPDLSMLGYLINRRVGAWLYNLGHTYLAPALLGATGFVTGTPVLYSMSLIWAAHIAFDRLAGYGLKYSIAFGATHLGGKGAAAEVAP
jgi:hypothetical protein